MCNLWYFGYLGNISNDYEPNKFSMTDYNVYFNNDLKSTFLFGTNFPFVDRSLWKSKIIIKYDKVIKTLHYMDFELPWHWIAQDPVINQINLNVTMLLKVVY